MKTITVRTEPMSTVAIVKEVASASPQGINVAQMRSRIRILDAAEKASDKIVLDDAEHATLVEAVNAMQWARADRGLLQIIDDILTPAE